VGSRREGRLSVASWCCKDFEDSRDHRASISREAQDDADIIRQHDEVLDG
jgi:hypothetical protein